jgi:hypothetical protein
MRFAILVLFSLTIQSSFAETKKIETPPLPPQKWSAPNPAPELWNEDQIMNCADNVFLGQVLSSNTKPRNTSSISSPTRKRTDHFFPL